MSLIAALRRRDARSLSVEKVVRLHLLDGALKLADVVFGARLAMYSQTFSGIVMSSSSALRRIMARRVSKSGGLNVCGEAPLETGEQALFERGDILRRTVGRQDDLALRLVERIEGVEELLLRGLLAGDELNIVDEENVRLAVPLAEFLRRAVADRLDHFVREFVSLYIKDIHLRVAEGDLVADGVQKVRLAKSRVAVDEERVIEARGLRRDGDRRGVRELVRRSDNERVKRVVIVGVALEALLLLLPEILGDDEFYLQAGAEHLVEGLREQGGVAALERLAVEVVGNLQDRRALREVEGDGRQSG